MEEIKLDVEVREEVGKKYLSKIRQANAFPGVVYGGKKKETLIKVDRRAFEHIRRIHHGESIIFRLNVTRDGKKLRDYSALVQEEQHDPVTDKILHVDFKRISLTEKITIKVPVVAKGIPEGVAKDGGSLDHILWEIAIECLPTNIPHKIEADVTALKIGDSIHVREIVFPEGVVTHHDKDSIVFTVVPPMKEEVIIEKVEGAAAEPEVIKEKKEKPEEAAAGDVKKPEAKKEEAPKAGAKAPPKEEKK